MVPLYSSRAWWGVAAAAAALVIGTNCGGGGDGGGNPVEPSVATSVQAASATSQDNQPAGGQVGQPPAVTVRDQRNSVMANVTVTFAVTAGNGTITPTTVATGGDGVARVTSWTLGTAPGVNVATATVGGLPVVTFNVTSVRAALSVQMASANDQQAPTNADVAEPPAVLVRDGAGDPMEGVTVSFAVTLGGGVVEPGSVVTDADGIARVTRWRLGANAGPNTLTATVTGLPVVTFNAEALLVPANVIAASSQSQAAQAGTTVAEPPAVLVRTAANAPVPGVTVTFAVTAGGGTIVPTTAVTGADGIARTTSWTLGTTPGANSVSATVAGLPAVAFSASGTEPPVPTSVTANSTVIQDAEAGAPVAAPPSVIVRDQFNNPMQGVTVNFAVTTGGGTLDPASVVTNAAGVATLTHWTLGSDGGANTVTATVAGLTPVEFSATGLLVPKSIAAVSATNQTDTVSLPVAAPPSVIVRDQNNNPLAGVSVAFAVTAGGGNVTPSNQITDAGGTATVSSWVLGPISGVNTLTATVAGLPPVVFTATAVDPCDPLDINVGAVVNGALAAGNCQLDTQEFVHFYRFTLAETKGIRIRQNSTQFDSYVLLLNSSLVVVGENDDADTNVLNSDLYAVLKPGTYYIGATSFDVGETGSYELRLEEVSASATDCTPYFIVRAMSTAQSLSLTDCDDSGFRSDFFIVRLQAGQQVTIDMTSGAVDAFLFLFDAGFNIVASNDDRTAGTTDARIVYTPTQDGYFIIGATSAVAGQTGNYVLTID
jgi:hypothetical protein